MQANVFAVKMEIVTSIQEPALNSKIEAFPIPVQSGAMLRLHVELMKCWSLIC